MLESISESAQRREEWIAALQDHEREVERLSRTLSELNNGVRRCDSANDDGWVWREIEFATAQVTRHRIRMALLSSRIASHRRC